ncbi:MAG: GGDEF domain-containing protein [Clostridia bacterium]|nr:GGDEF domain-containing protein [Clostridia bacterium]
MTEPESTAGMQPGVALLLTIIFILVAFTAVFFLYRGVRRERNRYISEKLKVKAMNKSAFDEMLTRKFRVAKKSTHFAVMLIKVLGGRDLYKSLGEKQYAAMITELQERFYAILPKGVKICPYEEDTFAIFMEEDLDVKAVSDLASFCLMEGKKPIVLVTKVKIAVELNVGIAIFDYSQGLSAEKFFANAKHALMSAEKNGANKFCVHSPESEFEDDQTAKYFRDVKSAIQNDEFLLHYQPIQSISGGEIVAFESLLRWNHKENGMLKANVFLPVLNQSGDIYRVGLDTFAKLCIAVNKYKQTHPQSAADIFSTNVSTRQMLLGSFPEELYRTAKKHHAEPADFCIEVSDFKTAAVVENIKKLKNYGFKVAVDGFNLSGSANTLSELQDIAPEWIKLPISFIKQCKDNFFARGMVDMLVRFSESDNVKIIATGLETEEEAEYAQELKINYGQGDYFGEETEELQ